MSFDDVNMDKVSEDRAGDELSRALTTYYNKHAEKPLEQIKAGAVAELASMCKDYENNFGSALITDEQIAEKIAIGIESRYQRALARYTEEEHDVYPHHRHGADGSARAPEFD